MQPTLLEQGITLMLVGMGTVFAFLSILVAAMSLLAVFVRRLTPSPADGGVSDEEIAAITIAIAQHRKNNR
jgi:oxaloacetate decarboxylase gamma subunit